MSNLKNMNTQLEKSTAVKDIFSLDFVQDRTIKNFVAVTGRKDGQNWYESEVLALMQVFADKPAYMKCDKMSIWGCLMTAARSGLSIAEGDLDLVPYGMILKADRNYRGMRKQLRNMPIVKFVGEAQVVWKDDEFEHDKLNNKIVKHVSKDAPKGVPTLDMVKAAYVRIEFQDRVEDVVMYNHELVAAKSKSKMGDAGPWLQYVGEMCKKSVIRRANKIHYQASAKPIADDQFAKYEIVDEELETDVAHAVTNEQAEQMVKDAQPEPEPIVEATPVQEAKPSAKKSNLKNFLESE